MSEYVYNYDIGIFQNGFEPIQLCNEIDDSPDIIANVSRINTDMSQTSLMIYFETELTIEEKAALDLIIQNHVQNDRSDYEFDQNIDLLNNRILNLDLPQYDTDGANKLYVDQSVIQSEQNATSYVNRIALDILEGRRDFDESQLDITKLSNIPTGGLVGVDARQTLSRKTIDIDAGNNIILNLNNSNIKAGARIDALKIGDGIINNTEFKRLSGIRSSIQVQIDDANTKTDSHTSQLDNPHEVTKTQVGLSNVQNIKSKYDAIRKPNNLDDRISGYSVGSFWFNNITAIGYVCTDSKELNAVWLEITSIGELTTGLNVGSGIGIYLDKIDAVHRFRSIIPGDNIFIDQQTNDITIRSRDTHSFLLCPTELEIISDTYRGILNFPWMRSEFGSYRSGKLIFEAEISVGSMGIRLRNMSEKTTLGEISDISQSGFYELAVANPPDNARMRVEVKRNGVIDESDNPRIFGIILKYVS